MSNKRALIRRERKEREKILNDKSEQGRERRIRLKGQNDGRTIAYYTILYILMDQYKFDSEKIEKMCSYIGEEAVKFSKPGEQFVVMHYGNQLSELIKKRRSKFIVKSGGDEWYQTERDDFYISTCSVIFIVLKDRFGFYVNKNRTGKLDVVMEYCAEELINIWEEPDMRTPEWYADRIKGRLSEAALTGKM